MPQPSLFESAELVPVDDERGRIDYTPRFVDTATAAEWFGELRASVQWRGERRMMYDRDVDVPRPMGHFRLDPAPASMPAAIRDAARLVNDRLGVPFNSVGLNLYRDGRDSVAPHNDHLNEIRKGFPIPLVSLGATRRMTIRAKAAPRRVIHIDLEAGSLFVMDYATQLHNTHAVPKTSEATSAVSVLSPRTIDSEAWTKPFFINGRAWASAHKPAGFRVFFSEDRQQATCGWLP